MTTRLRWIKPRWNRLFYDKTALISSIAFLSQSGWIHAPSSTRVNSLLPDHLIEHSIIISLDNCSMMIPYKLLIMGSTNNVWIILRSDQLSLHSIGHWLVSMVSYSCCVLDAVWSDGADASGIDSNWSIAKVIDAWWKLEIRRILYIFRRQCLALHLHPVCMIISSRMPLWTIISILCSIAQNSIVMISLIDWFISLKTSSRSSSIKGWVFLLFASFVLNELSTKSQSVSVLVDGFFA